MDPKIWGPNFWFSLHTVTLAYPDVPTYEERRRYHDFFTSLQYVLPCKLCREHYTNHLKEYPISIQLNSKEDLVKWCFNLHNRVNRSLGKEDFKYEDFREKYRKIYAPTIIEKIINPEQIKKYRKYKIGFLVVLLIIVFSLIFTYYKKNNSKKYFFK